MIDPYLLADPYRCLICGVTIDLGIHRCPACPRESWGDRFTRPVTRKERAERIAQLSADMWIVYSSAEVIASSIDMGNYNHVAKNFFEALYLLHRDGPGRHDLCGPVTFPEVRHLMDIRWWRTEVSCTVCRLEVELIILSSYEDIRHGMEIGSVMAEIRRRDRERAVREKLAAIGSGSVRDIVAGSMGGAR